VFRRLGTLVWGALGAFHIWLLAQQAWNGQVEYSEFVRWTVALGLASALVTLRRHGSSLFGDRRATAVWVLVALLHGPVLAERAEVATQALAEMPVVAVQIIGAAAGLGLALALAARGDAGHATDITAPKVAIWLRPIHALDAHVAPGFLPRPPPRA
jgi:hypothetical protein